MISYLDILIFAISPMVITMFLFVMYMLRLRRRNFNPNDDNRKEDWRKLSEELLSSEIEYHNKAIYQAFEFYIKITLAIFTGISLIVLTNQESVENSKILIHTGGILTAGVTLLFCVLVVSHQKGKIEEMET